MYPIYNLDYRKCLNCGKNTVVPYDNRGSQSSEFMLYTLTHMKCEQCGKEFYIKWIPKDEENLDELIPVCVDKDVVDITVDKIINDKQ